MTNTPKPPLPDFDFELEPLVGAHQLAWQAAIDYYGSVSRELNRAPTVYVDEWGDANLVSSRIFKSDRSMHAPVLDLDYSAALVPSSTKGHFHLYLGVAMKWRRYKRLLKALAKAGVIEWGYYKASVARKATYVRKPGVRKPDNVIQFPRNTKRDYELF